MQKNANIKIKEGNDKESAVYTQGVVRIENNSYYLEYELQHDRYIIGISEGIVTVTRSADESYTMLFQRDVPHPFEVLTPFGAIGFMLIPQNVEFTSTDEGINIALYYALDLLGNTHKEFQEFKLKIDCIYKTDC